MGHHALLLLLIGASLTKCTPVQQPLLAELTRPHKRLSGRFLQITDIHPDGHYKAHTAESKACHRTRKKKKKNKAGYYGTPYSDCDSPFSLVDLALDHLGSEWAAEIDFVIWTGDNARHDNDRQIPRTVAEIYDLNRQIAKKMDKLFHSKQIPVVPSLGNNDVWPHNIMTPGPNSITNEFNSIWEKFIPFTDRQVFQRGAYFSVEVIPNAVAVISLNTMYFYDSNKAVEGCSYLQPEDAGNLQFDWLEVQLDMYRSRGMQVYLSGHVPPSPGNYFPECYVRYAELSLRFQDTILGHLFGHMNDDFFFFVDARDLDIPDDVEEKAHDGLYDTLLNDFANLKKKDMDRYAVINVSPPIVPNPYLPTFRIFTYNTTKYEAISEAVRLERMGRKHGHHHGKDGKDKKKLCKKPQYKDTWRCHLDKPWHSDESSPSRTNVLWSPLGYAQYYLPDLKKSRKKRPPKFKLEYLTYPVTALNPQSGPLSNDSEFQYPIPVEHLPKSLRNATKTSSKYAPYALGDLTVKSWIELARRLVDKKEKKLRKRFKKYMKVGGK